MLRLDRIHGRLTESTAGTFDPAARSWDGAAVASGGDVVTAIAATTWLQRESGAPCRVPVGVIGPRQPHPDQIAAAEVLGRGLARVGLVVLCGGREGVMEAVCRGVAAEGGLSIGLLPGDDPASANAYVSVPVATGIGIARNAIIARAALCLVAIGGGYGTVSEAAYGLQFEKTVFGLAGAPELAGVRVCADVDEALERVARVALGFGPG